MIREKFSSNFPGIFPGLSSRTPARTPETATAFSIFLIVAFSSGKIANESDREEQYPRQPSPRRTSDSFAGVLRQFSEVEPELLRSCIYVKITTQIESQPILGRLLSEFASEPLNFSEVAPNAEMKKLFSPLQQSSLLLHFSRFSMAGF